MIKIGFKRPAQWHRLGQLELNKIKRLIISDLQAGLRAMHESIMLTPVYTGRTLVNYRWTTGAPAEGARAPVAKPDLPGKTSEMGLGSEPRRAANAAVVTTEFEALLASVRRNPFQDIYLVNNTPYFDQVEYGTYKTSAGSDQRTPPGGMTRRGETLLEVSILGLRRKSGGV